jgi:hypothetical protein
MSNVKWTASLDEALYEASARRRYVMLDFFSPT